MSGVRMYVVTVVLAADGRRSDLLAMAATLSRRRVAVLEAKLARPLDGRRVFTATFQASPARARLVLRTFQNHVDTLDTYLATTAEHAGATAPVPAVDAGTSR